MDGIAQSKELSLDDISALVLSQGESSPHPHTAASFLKQSDGETPCEYGRSLQWRECRYLNFSNDVDICGPTVTSYVSNAALTPSCIQKHPERFHTYGVLNALIYHYLRSLY
ncbi:hypothetical protein KIL84_009179 [Mauremys mutica]|uniref:Uncharacterized protein n=1 Tax=Mauremys mutica TaxID=74926 RepID=A0A9D4B3Q1_9SAUR|nr:hypothetical protein KIL84_009179 [Mauremys mutica]